LVIEVPDVARGGSGVLAAEPPRPVDDALGGVGDADPEGLAGEPERLIDPVAVAPGRAVLAGGGRDFEHDDRALLGGGLRGRQGLGERGQRVAGTGEPDRDQRPVPGQLGVVEREHPGPGRGFCPPVGVDGPRGAGQRVRGGVAVAARGGEAEGLGGVQPCPRGWVRGGADLLACLADEGESEFGVAAVGLERGQAAEHVPGEQVLPSLAGAADRHPVVGSCAADVVHVGVQPGREPRRLAGGGGHARCVRSLAGPREHAVGHLHVRGHAARQVAGGRGGVQPALRAGNRCQGRGRRLIDDCPRGQGDQGQRHCLAEVSPFRRIVTSRVAEPE
jgi:hypothetical protein